MGADYDHLRKFVLASTRMQLEQRYQSAVCAAQLDVLIEALASSGATLPEEMATKLRVQSQLIGESLEKLEEHADELITTLENYANG